MEAKGCLEDDGGAKVSNNKAMVKIRIMAIGSRLWVCSRVEVCEASIGERRCSYGTLDCAVPCVASRAVFAYSALHLCALISRSAKSKAKKFLSSFAKVTAASATTPPTWQPSGIASRSSGPIASCMWWTQGNSSTSTSSSRVPRKWAGSGWGRHWCEGGM